MIWHDWLWSMGVLPVSGEKQWRNIGWVMAGSREDMKREVSEEIKWNIGDCIPLSICMEFPVMQKNKITIWYNFTFIKEKMKLIIYFTSKIHLSLFPLLPGPSFLFNKWLVSHDYQPNLALFPYIEAGQDTKCE